MTTIVAAGRRALPLGYLDFARQLAIWFGFYVLYQLARGAADRDTAAAFDNGLKLIDLERRMGALWELSLQGVLGSSEVLIELTSWTYWLSQFAVLGLALLWVYLRRNEHFLRFRDTVLVANLIGLAGYVLLPTAPPRMFPGRGLRRHAGALLVDQPLERRGRGARRTRTRRCRRSTPPTRSSSAS